ncbi:MAG: hypothetical protein JRF56_05645, partial [Deltaproteobacteria bacterium]|nr:hypothetical protein [Deltaproteobacteria bacterium]
MKINILLKTLSILALALLFWGAEIIYAQVQIMPLGDSNTRGFNGDTYRSYLRQRLTSEAGIILDYVGTSVDVGGLHGPGPDFDTLYSNDLMIALDYDLEHEGWGGYTIGDIATNIDNWLVANPPDMILLMIGTNDLSSGSYQNEHDELNALINQILNRLPDVDLLVASIPPMGGALQTRNELVENYNRYIPSIVNGFAKIGHSVYFTDVYSSIDPIVDLFDEVHANSLGHEIIADTWYHVITQVIAGNNQPSVVITDPPDRAEFTEYADILISAEAADIDGSIDRVAFYADGTLIGESMSSPYEILWQSVPKGFYHISAIAFDNEGFGAYSSPLGIHVDDTIPDIRLVVGDLNLNFGDQAIKDRLELMGYIVHLRDDGAVSAADADGMDLVLVSATASSRQVTSTYRDVAVGVVVCESYLFDDLVFTGPTGGDDFGVATSQVAVDILDASHPIAAGLSGTVMVVDDAEGFFLWGRP